MFPSIQGMAPALMSLAVTAVLGASLAMRTALAPVAVMQSATDMSLSRYLRSITLTSLLNAICSLKNTVPRIFPGPPAECAAGTSRTVDPSVILTLSIRCSHRS